MIPSAASALLAVLGVLRAQGGAEVAHYRLAGPMPWRDVRPVEGPGYRIALSSPDGARLEVQVEVTGGALPDAPFPPRGGSLPDEARAVLEPLPSDPEADALARVLTRGSTSILEAVERVIAFTSRRVHYELPTGEPETALSCRRQMRGSCVGRSLLAADLLMRCGVPARQVTGVLTAAAASELTPDSRPAFSAALGGIRHRWIEVFVPGLGWVPSDPGGLANTVTSRHLALARVPEATFGVTTLARSPELRWPAVEAPWRGLTLGRPRGDHTPGASLGAR